MISPIFRDILIEHIDGPVQIIVGDPHRSTRLRALRSLGLLRFDHYSSSRPRQTHITEKGRAALAEALADWADALVRAQEAIQRLREPAAEAESALEPA
jgi:DNA-binding PadR family transcriptional regulator